jgi:flagellar hook-length control protein FliK
MVMMTTDSTPTGLSGLLSQILGGLGESGVLESADGGEFVQSLAGQIKSLLIRHGDDPVEVAAIDDQALVAQFFALVQGQGEPLAGGLSVTTGLSGLMGGTTTPSVSDEEGTVSADESSEDPLERELEAAFCVAALPSVVLDRLTESGRILPTNAQTSESLVNLSAPTLTVVDSTDSAPVDLETLARAFLQQVTPSAAPAGEVPEMTSQPDSAPVSLATLARALLQQVAPSAAPAGDVPERTSQPDSAPVSLATLARALLQQVTPSAAPAGEVPEMTSQPDSVPVSLATLARALLQQVTPSAALEGEVPEMTSQPDSAPVDLQAAESAPVLPAWLARQLNSDGSGTWLNSAMFASTASGVLADQPSDSTREALPVSATRGDRLLESALDLKTSMESGELAPAGAMRTPGTTTETPMVGVRLQTLDLNRLLQPGGERLLAEQVRWSVDKGLETAEIKLHPPSLGTLDVRIVQDGDKTHVQFVSAHPIAREVLEAAMPRLREALAQDGVWLGNVSVSDQAPKDRGGTGQEGRESTGTTAQETEDDEERLEPHGTISVLSRRLDVFS